MKIDSGDGRTIFLGQVGLPLPCLLTVAPVFPLLCHNPARWTLLEILMKQESLDIPILSLLLSLINIQVEDLVCFSEADSTLTSTELGSFVLGD